MRDLNILHHQADKPYGCNLYCIANLLNLTKEQLEVELRILESRSQTNEGRYFTDFSENQLLQRHKPNWYASTYWCIPSEHDVYIPSYSTNVFMTPSNYRKKDAKEYFGFLCSIAINRSQRHRILLLKELGDDLIYVINPAKALICITNNERVFDLKLIGISTIRDLSDEDKQVIFTEEMVAHLIPLVKKGDL